MTETVRWTDEIRQLVKPGRDIDPGGWQPAAADYKKLRKIVLEYYNLGHPLLKSAEQTPAVAKVNRALRRRLLSRKRAVQTAPLKLEQEALLMALVSVIEQWGDRVKAKVWVVERMIQRWMQAMGPAFAVRALVASMDWRIVHNGASMSNSRQRRLPKLTAVDDAKILNEPIDLVALSDWYWGPHRERFEILRRHLITATPEGHAEALSVATGLWEGAPARLKLALAVAFPGEQAWAKAAMALTNDDVPQLLLSLKDPADAAALIATLDNKGAIERASLHAATLVAIHGAAVMPLLEALYRGAIKHDAGGWVSHPLTEVIACIVSQPAVAFTVWENYSQYTALENSTLLSHPQWSLPAMLDRALNSESDYDRETAVGGLERIVAHDPAAARAVREALTGDCGPLDVVLAKYGTPSAAQSDLPGPLQGAHGREDAMPYCWRPTEFPPIHLRDGGLPLPPSAVEHLGDLMRAADGALTPELVQVKAACVPEDLEAFAWAHFLKWDDMSGRVSHRWVLWVLAWLGGAETAEKLRPYILSHWMRSSLFAVSLNGLEVLRRMGSDAALLQLHLVALRSSSSALRSRAEEKLAEAAADQGVDVEALTDRLVPTLGLDERGECTLDYGARSFRVSLTAALVPQVHLTDGKLRRSPPPTVDGDDAAKVKAAKARFTRLKRDLSLLSGGLIKRLERRLRSQEPWSSAVAQRRLFIHPLLASLARRLVWSVTAPGSAPVCFTVGVAGAAIAWDGTPVTLPEGGQVRLVHPLHLTRASVWKAAVGAQPFPQIERPTFPTAGDVLSDVEGKTVPASRVTALLSRGWRRGPPMDNGAVHVYHRDLPDESTASLPVSPGITFGGGNPDQTLGAVQISPTGEGLDAVAVSELRLDLARLVR